MHPVDSFIERVRDALILSVVSTMLVIFGQALQPIYETRETIEATTEFTLWIFFALFESFPGIITLAGILAATVIAGPLGFFGAILETIGANQFLFGGHVGGFWVAVFGALMVVIGSFIPWLRLFSVWMDSQSRY
ncbi:hypothetical protein [Natrinema halophilum]|uniref:Uncharacterized protein n=1 Tax=Natrinema halophilum TaxID=1699371 RepID=A0A7D5GUZ7_9EURY|nr:hypothetical protein [Natrinema halophilum]QLG51089.1 hypothetical protein HYG82_20765 [Natrinema halophilum]